MKEYQFGLAYIFNAEVWNITDELTLLIGGKTSLDFRRAEGTTTSGINDPFTFTTTHLNLGGISELRYVVNQQLFLLLNMSLLNISYGPETLKNENPAIPLNLAEQSSFNLEGYAFHHFAIGLGYIFQ